VLDLRSATSPDWLELVFGEFDAFLVDHAACERKAAQTGLALVGRVRERADFVQALTEFAVEELDHFRIVCRHLALRGLTLGPDQPDRYVQGLQESARRHEPKGTLDRLLLAGIIEARSCERLAMVTAELPARGHAELHGEYLEMTRAEARHHALFFRFARELFGEVATRQRADQLLAFEAEWLAQLPLLPLVH